MSKLTLDDFISTSPKSSTTAVGATLGENKNGKHIVKLHYPEIMDRILIIQNHDIKTWYHAVNNPQILKDIQKLLPKQK